MDDPNFFPCRKLTDKEQKLINAFLGIEPKKLSRKYRKKLIKDVQDEWDSIDKVNKYDTKRNA